MNGGFRRCRNLLKRVRRLVREVFGVVGSVFLLFLLLYNTGKLKKIIMN